MEDIGKKKLLSILEGVFHNHVVNNGKTIRYPITFDENKEIRGNFILKVTEENSSFFFSGRYQFGANALYIYKAIDSLLEKLDDLGILDTYALGSLIEEYQDEED